jgi:hypothetical protein
MAGSGHITHLSLNKERFYNTFFSFLEMPPRKDTAAH